MSEYRKQRKIKWDKEGKKGWKKSEGKKRRERKRGG